MARDVPAIAKSFVYGMKYLDALYLLRVGAFVSSTCFLLLFGVFTTVRMDALRKSDKIIGRGAATFGAFASSGFLLLPFSNQTTWLAFLSASLMSLGTALSAYSLTYLGRAISIFPEVRALVLNGPYRLVRHPIYLGEAVALVGTMLLYELPWSILLLSLILTAQWIRILQEEALLGQTFPAYATYKLSSYYLFPGVF